TALPTPSLEGKLRRELELPRIEHIPRSAEKRIRDRRTSRGTASYLELFDRNRGAILVARWNLSAAEVVRAVYGDHLVHVWPIELVECVDGQLEPPLLTELEIAREPNIPRHELVAPVRIPRGRSYTIGHRIRVSIGIESHKQGEGPRGLRCDDAAEF